VVTSNFGTTQSVCWPIQWREEFAQIALEHRWLRFAQILHPVLWSCRPSAVPSTLRTYGGQCSLADCHAASKPSTSSCSGRFRPSMKTEKGHRHMHERVSLDSNERREQLLGQAKYSTGGFSSTPMPPELSLSPALEGPGLAASDTQSHYGSGSAMWVLLIVILSFPSTI